MQYLGQWVTPRGSEFGEPSEQNPEITRQTAKTLAALATDSRIAHTSIPGTSLMVLIDMQGGGGRGGGLVEDYRAGADPLVGAEFLLQLADHQREAAVF